MDDVLDLIHNGAWPGVQIHRTAVVEAGAVIGAGTKIWHFAHVRADAVIGKDCIIGKDCYIDADAWIGNRVHLQNGVSVYRGVTLDDDVFVGPHAVFTNDLTPRSRGAWVCVPTLIKKGASIGANATILCGVTIGAWAMVGAGAVVTHTVLPGRLVYGNPARDEGPAPRMEGRDDL
jgi:acetyltransferase-like isoleucine patch superfamily enzyme